MNKNLKNKILLISIITIISVIMNFAIVSNSLAYSIQNANLYSKGDCGNLLKYKTMVVETSFVVYNNGEGEFPAYCLDKTKAGVSENGGYSVSVDSVLSNVMVWKVIINGYPYKTVSELGCENEKEAFTATKQAVYTVLHGNKVEDYSGIGEAGERTLRALNQIVAAANNSSETKISSDLTIIAENDNWEVDKINSKYVSKTFKVTSKASMQKYKINIESGKTDDTIITDIQNNEKNEFNASDKFKVLIPIMELGEGGEIKIKATSSVKTKPVFYGKSPNSSLQDYALTAGTYEDGTGIALLDYNKNETKIKIIKQDTDTKTPLQGATFDLLDNNKNIIQTNLVSDETGKILLKNIMPGKYYLKETKAPIGYDLYEDYIELDVKLYEEISVLVNNSKEEKPTVETTKNKIEVTPQPTTQVKLPKTGM